MSPAPILSNDGQQNPESKNLSIEIEPSYPLIVATAEFFRAQKKPRQSLELCRLGLNHFPGDMGLRLGMAMSYLDLSEKEKARMEIKTVVQELKQLAPVLDSISKNLRHNEQNKLSDWFHQLSQVLTNYPEEDSEGKSDTPVPSLFPEEEFRTGTDSPIPANPPQGILETKAYFQNSDKEASLLNPRKIEAGKEMPKGVASDSNILSTLTGWLSQLKEEKA
jgi:hypothetical protein